MSEDTIRIMSRCNICYLPIHDAATSIPCPRCFNTFHRDHLAGWLLNETQCPMCREELSEDFRAEFRPKSDRERQRLEDIMRSLDGLGYMLEKTEKKYARRVKAAREREFGIERTSFGSYFKIIVPFVFLGLFVIVLIAAVNDAGPF